MSRVLKKLNVAFGKAGLRGDQANDGITNGHQTNANDDSISVLSLTATYQGSAYRNTTALCPRCYSGWAPYAKRRDHWPEYLISEEWMEFPDFTILNDRVRATGCASCTFLLSVLREQTPLWSETSGDEPLPSFLLRPRIIEHDEHVELIVRPEANVKRLQRPPHDEFRLSLDCSFEGEFGHRNDRDPLNPQNIASMRDFLSSFRRRHTKLEAATPFYTPTRLVAVGGSGEMINLVTLDSWEPKPVYATLSYSWGRPREDMKPYKTTMSNVDSRYHGFSLADQPLAIQDAVKVTRALNIPYLWIDALCIIQGDTEDWLHQGMQMDGIYESSFVTIVALTTRSVYESFLYRPFHSLDVKLIFRKGSAASTTRSIRITYPRLKSGSEALLESNWAQRGWTTQEAALSRRILFFAPQFFCLKDGDDQLVEGKDNPRIWSNFEHLPDVSTLRLRQSPVSRQQLYNLWYKILTQYTQRKFTYDSDRLIAIAGISNRLMEQARSFGSELVFGVWTGDIVRALAWSRAGKRLEKRVRHVPTWSWASIPGAINCADEVKLWDLTRFEYESCSSEGSLTIIAKLYGPVKAMDLRPLYSSNLGMREQWHPDTWEDDPYGGWRNNALVDVGPEPCPMAEVNTPFVATLHQELLEYFFLHVFSSQKTDPFSERQYTLHCTLVLEKTQLSDEPGSVVKYRRRGRRYWEDDELMIIGSTPLHRVVLV